MLLEDAQVDSVLTYDVPIIMSIPVVLSIRYYDKQLIIATIIASVGRKMVFAQDSESRKHERIASVYEQTYKRNPKEQDRCTLWRTAQI